MDEGGDDVEGDVDVNLVPQMVENVVLPIVSHAVNRAWDTRSSMQSKSLADVTAELMMYLVDDNDNQKESLKELIDEIIATLREEQRAMTVRSWPHAFTIHAKNAEDLAKETVGRAVKLISNISIWHRVIPLQTIEDMLGDLIPRCIMPTLHILSSANTEEALSLMLR